MARLKKGTRGFTLVELLIVVAIIGVLSTIGVPTFRKMVTKAKKSEAKVALGGLFTVESAFFTEYNTYGNRLDKIGFEIEGTQRLYHVGFPDTACADQTTIQPDESTIKGTLTNQYNGYYSTTPAAITVSPRQTSATSVTTGTTTTQNYGCFASSFTYPGASAATAYGVAANGTSYMASATGNIAPGVAANASVATSCTSNCQDVWVINHNRSLINAVDGTK